MAKVMLRQDGDKIYFYVAKKDMEEVIETIEFEDEDNWGGEVTLTNKEIWWIKPEAKNLPKETVCKKLSN